jgi:hypothetical protein
VEAVAVYNSYDIKDPLRALGAFSSTLNPEPSILNPEP